MASGCCKLACSATHAGRAGNAWRCSPHPAARAGGRPLVFLASRHPGVHNIMSERYYSKFLAHWEARLGIITWYWPAAHAYTFVPSGQNVPAEQIVQALDSGYDPGLHAESILRSPRTACRKTRRERVTEILLRRSFFSFIVVEYPPTNPRIRLFECSRATYESYM